MGYHWCSKHGECAHSCLDCNSNRGWQLFDDIKLNVWYREDDFHIPCPTEQRISIEEITNDNDKLLLKYWETKYPKLILIDQNGNDFWPRAEGIITIPKNTTIRINKIHDRNIFDDRKYKIIIPCAIRNNNDNDDE